ncbi:TIGR01777 family oxidoreductase [Millisia brevis]|uniref:TIGR01777 family oxidoreductase n=1 Tax=Millisia brevis TaxID=264148 RepID=UPI00082F441A|nr:TIGR01777 family oxidoreductase [Millisia brevis]
MSFRQTDDFDTSPEQLWAWLSRPGAIHRLMPPWQPITVVREAANLRDGRAQLRVLGLPWTARHDPSGYIEGSRFVDELLVPVPGFLPLPTVVPWRHEHTLEASPTGVNMTDEVSTPAPGALLDGIFRYRTRQVRDDLAAHRRYSATPLTVAVTGTNGMIGTALTALLSTGGHRVIKLVRKASGGDTLEQRVWDPAAPTPELFADVDAVVHLAGAPILGRFTEGHKQKVRDSRVGPTKLLARAASAAGVSTFVSGSAIGFYGADRGDEELPETAGRGTGFLADVVADWEADAVDGVGPDTRLVRVRTGVVLSPAGGMLRLLYPMFAAGLGGPLGDGKQWFSWISLDDMVELLLRAVTDPELSGPINAVAPHPVRYSEFAHTLGKVLHRPAILPVPSLGPQVLLGREGAEEFAQADQRVVAAKLSDAGHHYRHPTIDVALAHLLGKAD